MRDIILFLFLGLTFVAGSVRAEDAKPTHELVGKFAPLLTRVHDEAWINSAPLTWGGLNGKVVLLEMWSMGSWGSIRSLAWMRELYARRRSQGLEIIAVHSPEFPHEKDRGALLRKLKEFEITYPVMLDEDGAFSQSIGGLAVRPTFFLIDKRGKVHSVFEGEALSGDATAKSVESDISILLEQVK